MYHTYIVHVTNCHTQRSRTHTRIQLVTVRSFLAPYMLARDGAHVISTINGGTT